MKNPRHNAGLGIERGGTGDVQRNFAVQGRFCLEDAQEHFSEPQQRVRSAMR